MEVPGYGKFKGQDWPDQEKGFASMIANLDNSVKIIMDKLEELHLDNNTLVIFCSDNGPHQEGGHLADFFDSNGIYRGTKRDFYDGGVRTPFLARWPAAIQPGQVSGHLSAFWDFLPTFAELTRSEKPAGTDGISFLPALLGKEQKEKHDYLYWEFFELGGKQAILKGKWKAIRLNVREIPEKQVFELYDLENDPGETNNVAESHPLMVKEFMELFSTAREEFSVTPLLTKDSKNVETPF
jgi:arylsulfatase A-like enzyme